jgi:multiple sugar transport system ATP-binding protein
VELTPSESNNGNQQYTVQGRVILVENLGMSDLVSVKVKGVEHITLRALIPSDRPWRQEELTLLLPPEHLHWFHREQGERLANRESQPTDEQHRHEQNRGERNQEIEERRG